MKKAWIIFFLCVGNVGAADVQRAVYNRYSGRPDFVTNVSSLVAGDLPGLTTNFATVFATNTSRLSSTATYTAAQTFSSATVNGRFEVNGGSLTVANPYGLQVGTMVIAQQGSGNVGIGTTGPVSKLTIYDNTDGDIPFLSLRHATNYGANLGVNTDVTGDFFIQTVIAGTATKRLTIQRADGNVGIGTTSPGAKLEVFAGAVASEGILVKGSSSPKIEVRSTGSTVNLDLQADDGAGYVGTASNHPLILRANGTEWVRIKTDGNVGIGNTTPSSLLDVAGGSITIRGTNSGLNIKGGPVTGSALCLNASGNLAVCTSVVSVTGTCTCP